MKSLAKGALASIALFSIGSANAADINVRIENLTNSIYYTPFLVAAHPDGTSLFTSGQPASANLQAMAEGGDISGLVIDLQGLGATIAENPAGGLLAPATSTNVDINTDGTQNTLLSAVAMLLPTNDAFAGLNSIVIPTDPGTYVYNVSAYDAGTEANDELITGGGAPGAPGIPADPSGASGTGGTGAATADANTNVHIHRGSLGDTDNAAGASDLDSRVHRWLNPVVRVTVTVR
ncbi:MAG: spondin domain-containing protein [Gammaproteobacteria bacterium]|nr:spondin domain-containing protein [Gammaproteobacteria bacterium]